VRASARAAATGFRGHGGGRGTGPPLGLAGLYPLATRVPVLAKDPAGLAEGVWRDLEAFTKGGPCDDVALLTLSLEGRSHPGRTRP